MNLLNKIIDKFKKNKILVLDDVESNVDLISSYLDTINDVKIYKSYNPLDAEKLLTDYDFTLIILDIQMPYIDGYSLAIKIKSNEYGKNKNTPIIFVTGIYNSEIDKIRGYNIGSIDYILKPVDFDNFIEKVEKYLNIGNDDSYFIEEKMQNIKKSVDI